MSNAAKNKGDAFERLVIDFLRRWFGQHLVRPRAGAEEDRGDIAGVPGFTLEAKSYRDLATGIRVGLADLEAEQRNAGTRWGAVILKRPRSQDPTRQLVVMELGQWADLVSQLPGVTAMRTVVDL